MTIASRRIALLSTLVAAVIGALIASALPARAATVVAQWTMEDGGTTMADVSGHGHTGTLHGVTVRQPAGPGSASGSRGPLPT